jgi:hypothetical protein
MASWLLSGAIYAGSWIWTSRNTGCLEDAESLQKAGEVEE